MLQTCISVSSALWGLSSCEWWWRWGWEGETAQSLFRPNQLAWRQKCQPSLNPGVLGVLPFITKNIDLISLLWGQQAMVRFSHQQSKWRDWSIADQPDRKDFLSEYHDNSSLQTLFYSNPELTQMYGFFKSLSVLSTIIGWGVLRSTHFQKRFLKKLDVHISHAR